MADNDTVSAANKSTTISTYSSTDDATNGTAINATNRATVGTTYSQTFRSTIYGPNYAAICAAKYDANKTAFLSTIRRPDNTTVW
jgi:hypothetical protein